MNKLHPLIKSRPPAKPLAEHRAHSARYLAILQKFTEDQAPSAMCVVATVDGIEVAALNPKREYRPAQLAAMASSLLAVAGAAGREVGHAACDRLIVESSTGKLLMKPVGANSGLVLCMALPADVLLGKALWAADEIARSISSP